MSSWTWSGFFEGAEVAVLVNGGETSSFSIQCGVRQGCPIVPYLFLLVGEALNLVAKRLITQGKLSGLRLPKNVDELLISQYANDTNFLLAGNQSNFARLIHLLDSYGLALGLFMNWHKSLAYWVSLIPTCLWLDLLPCPWALLNELSKLLDTPFGLKISTLEVDKFLYQKLQKKKDYWSGTHLSLAGRSVIVNSVLLSTLWYFICIWGGSLKIIRHM
jgi:hypothetical protein